MIKQVKIAGLAIAFWSAGAAVSYAETLADALTLAYNNSGLLEQNRALLRAADEDLAQSVASTLPVIGWAFSASDSRPNTAGTDLLNATASISASLTLYDGGANQLAVEAQKETILGTRQSLRSVEQDVLLRAIQAYMNVRSDTEFVSLRENNVRVLTQEFRAAQDRFDVGEVTRTDVALAEARLAAARSLLASAQGELARSNEEYRAAVGRAPGRLAPVSPAPASRSIREAKNFAVRNHPDILQAQHAVAAAELNIRRAEAGIGPTISLEGFAAVDSDNNTSSQIGIEASGPIYQGGRLSSQVRQFMSRRDASRSSLLVTAQGIEQEVGNAYSFLEVARASRLASDQQIRAARVAFEGVREEATLGSRTTLDVLNAEQELLDAQANLISAQAEEVIASYSVLSAMGLLNADHLRLPVQQYDPSQYYNLAKDAPITISPQGQALDRVLKSIGGD